ncbi:MAG TPA: ABC transporter permease subunit [Candidatus Binatia bacterium]|nr:ABC transporter permease subunit [Candidatus Binatia bacterium]
MSVTGRAHGAGRRSAVGDFGSAVWTIMVKELRSRMRGRRAFIVLTLYLAMLALITYGVYVVVGPAARAVAGQPVGIGFGSSNASAIIGQWIFSALSIFQVVLVSMIAPAFTAGQISLEREKQTLDLLISTPMRPGAIIIGKLLTALAFVVLMVVAAIPITAIVLMYGGASIDDIVRQQLLLLSVAIGFGAVGIFASALMRRTQAATVVTYGAVLVLTLGSAMTFAFWDEVATRSESGFVTQPRDGAPEALRYLNPMVGMLDIVSRVETTGPTRFTQALYQLFGEDLAGGGQFGIGVGGCDGFDCGDFRDLGQPVPPEVVLVGDDGSDYWWPRVSISFLVVAAILTAASMGLVVPPGMRWAFRRRSARLRGADPYGIEDPETEGSPRIEELVEGER